MDHLRYFISSQTLLCTPVYLFYPLTPLLSYSLALPPYLPTSLPYLSSQTLPLSNSPHTPNPSFLYA